jgi:saccharopine dehydrogenase-like NADP-dependent oxidoreductase
MQKILIIGAGRSSSSLIKYLLENASDNNWFITVSDMSLELAQQKIQGFKNATAIAFDINNVEQRTKEISNADIVVSMLPAFMHIEVAKDCIKFKKHLITASYVSNEMAALDKNAQKAGVLFLNEMGLDPGIDHMSAMEIIHKIKEQGGEIISFKSYCGGLVAPESNDNLWGYKFSWNPRNVILAGQGTAQYIENGKYKFLPYNRLFTQIENIEIDGYGTFDGYANRDSLSYRSSYGLENIPTMLRGTLRMPGYCKAWNIFVKLGWTDDTYKIANSNELSYAQLLDAFLPVGTGDLKKRLANFMGISETSEEITKVEWLEIFTDKKIKTANASPAQILQELLEEKWLLKTHDKDMIVMQHLFEYVLNGNTHKINSSLVVKGDDQIYTAMAKTVGLPVAIGVKMILKGELNLSGVKIPTCKEIYEPVLKELKNYGISFIEK